MAAEATRVKPGSPPAIPLTGSIKASPSAQAAATVHGVAVAGIGKALSPPNLPKAGAAPPPFLLPPPPPDPLEDFVEGILLFEFGATQSNILSFPKEKMSQLGMKYKEGMVCKALREDGKGLIYYFPLKFHNPDPVLGIPYYSIKQEGQDFIAEIVWVEDPSKTTSWVFKEPMSFTIQEFETSEAKEFVVGLTSGLNEVYAPNLAVSPSRRRSTEAVDLRMNAAVRAGIEKTPEHGAVSLKTIESFMTEHIFIPFHCVMPVITGHVFEHLFKTKEKIEARKITKCAPDASKAVYIVPLKAKKKELSETQRAFLFIADQGNGLFLPTITIHDYKLQKKVSSVMVEAIDTKQKGYVNGDSFQFILRLFRNGNEDFWPDIDSRARKDSVMTGGDKASPRKAVGAAAAAGAGGGAVEQLPSESPKKFMQFMAPKLTLHTFHQPADELLNLRAIHKLPVKGSDGTCLFPLDLLLQKSKEGEEFFLRVNDIGAGVINIAILSIDYSQQPVKPLLAETWGTVDTHKEMKPVERVKKLLDGKDLKYRLKS